ncbi:MAG TPA: glycosyltransferase, partial [Pyrinomonadaceae bacterium]|nr:glycosyltransferase [Pyrinomonadaceae bacterium]
GRKSETEAAASVAATRVAAANGSRRPSSSSSSSSARWARPLRRLRSVPGFVRNHVNLALRLRERKAAMTAPAPGDMLERPPAEVLKYLHYYSQEVITEAAYKAAAARILDEHERFHPDVIHGHIYHGLGLGLFLKSVCGRPLVYQVSARFSQLRDSNVGWLPLEFERFHPWVDRFFTAYPEELLGVGVPAEKVLQASGVVDLQGVERVKRERERHRLEVRRDLGIAEDAQLALSVGRLQSLKGHQYALEALRFLVGRFPNLHFVIAGTGPAEERAALEARARDLGVHERTHFLGFMNDPLPLYAASDIYLRAYLFEADNLSSIKAMAMGLPVVGFQVTGGLELVSETGHGLLVAPRDAEAMAEAAARILSLPDSGREMGSRGVSYCRQHLDFQRAVSMLEATYAELHRAGTGQNESAATVASHTGLI